MPHKSIRRQPTSTPCVFLEVSKYKFHKLWLVNCVQWLVKLEFNNVQELEPIDASLLRSTNVQFSLEISFQGRSSDCLYEFTV